jgi:hypothetical protein
MAMPLQIYRNQRLLFSRSAHGEMLALHGNGEAITRVLLHTPVLYDLTPMTFPKRHGCYIWAGTLVEETDTEAPSVITRFWPGSLQEVASVDLTDIFIGFGDHTIGQAILMATYKASFGMAESADSSIDAQRKPSRD